MEKMKSLLVKTCVLIINAALVLGGALYIKNNQQKKQAALDLAANINANDIANKQQQQLSEQARQLQQIVQQNREQKNQATNNSGTVTVQRPKTVTQTIPAVTTQKTTKSS